MENINPKDVPDIDIDTISYITLKNGNVFVLDDATPENPNKPKKKTDTNLDSKINQQPTNTYQISNNTNFTYKAKINENKKPTITENSLIRTKFNGIQKISNNTNFFYLGKINLPKTNNDNNKNPLIDNSINNKQSIKNNNNSDKQDSDNDLFKINIADINKNKNNENTDKPDLTKKVNELPKKDENIENNINKKESNKEINNTQNDNQATKLSSQKRIEKILADNKHSVKAVISLNIPSDIPYDKNNIQRQFNILLDQLNRKKKRIKKSEDENYKRYYELYKNKNEKIFFNKPLQNRIKYYNESNDLDYQLTNYGDINVSTINNNSNNYYNNTWYNTGRKSINLSRIEDLKAKTIYNGWKYRSSSRDRFKEKNIYSDGIVMPSNLFHK